MRIAGQFLAREEIERRLESYLDKLNKRIISGRDENDAFELTLRATEVRRALNLFQDFSFMNEQDRNTESLQEVRQADI